ncbi:MAG: TIGR02452 family protein [Coriobacteriales bacterium]|jgi:uncharacterized protein (TIGR02452 family)
MATRKDERRADAEKHIKTMNAVFSSETAQSIEGIREYKDGEARELPAPEATAESTEIAVERTNAVSAIYAAKGKVIVLDFASFIHPGGGYANGAWAQEEALCSESNLYPILASQKETFYDANRQYSRGGLYTDRSLFVPDVVFARGGSVRKAGVIVTAAPNRIWALEHHRDQKEIDADLANRIETVMAIAADQGCDTLVLGAFGCGVFGNDPVQVAALFKQWLEAHPNIFAKVVFAIPGGPNLDAFQDAFGHKEEQVVEAATEEEDDDDWRNDLDLPEGITLR